MTAGVVVIGRNEGDRLKACLRSLEGAETIVYVDSGSDDDSVAFARGMDVTVVELDIPPAFSAARARNAGLQALLSIAPETDVVQMVDGDCTVAPGWIDTATEVLRAEPDIAIVFGRTRERHPDRSIYNAMCDDEWNVPLGDAAGCGGNAFIRISALRAVDGYDESILAGEDSEMCWRMRQRGWTLRHVADEMTRHDAAITRFGQWWLRTKRGGHGFAQMADLHPDARRPDWRKTCRSIMIWGGVVPLAIGVTLLLAAVHDGSWLYLTGAMLAVIVLKILQIARRKLGGGLPLRVALASGFFLMIGKVPELFGAIRYHRNRLLNRRSELIEYRKYRTR